MDAQDTNIETSVIYRIYHPKTGGYHIQQFKTKNAAISEAKKKSTCESEKDRKYWDGQFNVIQKIITITETVRIVRPEEKV